MTSRFDLDEIRHFWAEQARKHGQSADASWSDTGVIALEVREIARYLADGDRVLDVGCGNGFSTVQFAMARRIWVRGVDYVPEMIEQARQRLRDLGSETASRVEFAVGDVLKLVEPNTYDKVVVVRVLINLATWERQANALASCAAVLKPGGTLLLSEATVQGWQRLNSLREEWGLRPIPVPPFNEYVDEDQLIAEAQRHFASVTMLNFASTYYVGTRVLKPLLVTALGLSIDVADPKMEWNRWFSQLPAWGDYGTQKLFVLRKGV